MSLDLVIFKAIFSSVGKFRPLDWLGIFLADYLGYFLILATFIFLIRGRSWRQRFYYISLISVSLLLSRGIITELIRFLFARPRPFLAIGITPLINHDMTNSFPSGHAAFYFALAIAVLYCNRRWGWWFLAGATLIGISRVFTGVHWPTDIVGGIAVAFLSVFVVKLLLRFPHIDSINKESDS